MLRLDSRNFSNSKPNENSLISGDMSYEKNKTQLPLLDDAVIGKLKEINNLPNSNQGANIKKIFPKVLSNSLLQEREEFRRIEKRDKIVIVSLKLERYR